MGQGTEGERPPVFCARTDWEFEKVLGVSGDDTIVN